MEGARKIINKFLTTKYSGNELKSELFRAAKPLARKAGPTWTQLSS